MKRYKKGKKKKTKTKTESKQYKFKTGENNCLSINDVTEENL